MGVGFQPQPLGFQRNSTAAGKGVQQGRRVIVGGAQDLCLGSRQHLRVVGVFPLDQLFQNAKQPLSLGVLGFLGGVQLRVGRGVVHKAGPDHGSSGRRAHHRCKVDGCPCRMDFSRAASALIASSGRATSISFLDISYLQFFVKSFQADLRLKEVRFGLAWTTKLKNLYLQYEELNSIRRSQE